MIDFHCHLDLYPDPTSVVHECARRGLTVLSVTTTPSAWNGTHGLGLANGNILTALGLHPQLAKGRKHELEMFDAILPRTRYVGEVGLDGSPESQGSWGDQLLVFRRILDSCSREGGRVLSIHSRRASKAVLDELASHPRVGIPVLHWFSGSKADLDRAIMLGCWFSIGPPMLGTPRGRELVAAMPRGRVLTESDGPFVQDEGGPIMPWGVQKMNESLGALWTIPADEVSQVVQENLTGLVEKSGPDRE